ncbi:recombinase family protein [Kitasatospora sp. NPDC101801]|uniref:recombinase family protein n=1 Tax=Kitasatospora sp. NPDC101801 TaxID=3364103 RepID=UPI0038153CED
MTGTLTETTVRADRATLLGLGFTPAQLADLGLWEVATGTPDELAEGYARRSRKQDDLATLRGHVRDIARRAHEHGVKIRHIWFEQKSASKSWVRRTEFDGACDAVLAGISRALYVWKTDRLSREGMGKVGVLLDAFDQRRAGLVSVTEGLDSRKGGRILFAFLSERAREEAAEIAFRVTNGIKVHKEEGCFTGGRAPFGLEAYGPKGAKRVRPHGAEYGVSRRIGIRLWENRRPKEIVAELTADGAVRRNGKPWTERAIVELAHSPCWAGLVPESRPVLDEFGQPTGKYDRPGALMGPDGLPVTCGEGVVTYSEWVTIQGNLAARSTDRPRATGRGRGHRQRTALLPLILRCPHCGGPAKSGGVVLTCRTRVEQGPAACVGFTTASARLEAAVEVLWINHVRSLPPGSVTVQAIGRRWLGFMNPEQTAQRDKLRSALQQAGERRAQLDDRYYLKGNMPERDYVRLAEALDLQVVTLTGQLSALSGEDDLAPLGDGETLAELWAGQDIDGRRALLQAALGHLTVRPAARPGDRTPIADRVVVTWIDDPQPGVRKLAVQAAQRTRQRKAKARQPVASGSQTQAA